MNNAIRTLTATLLFSAVALAIAPASAQETGVAQQGNTAANTRHDWGWDGNWDRNFNRNRNVNLNRNVSRNANANLNRNRNTNVATGGNASATGGNASATNAGNTVSISEQNPDDVTIRQAPAVLTAAAPATVSCYRTAAGGISGVLGGLSISGGAIDANCEMRELARVAASVDGEAGLRVLCLSEAFQIANPAKCTGIPAIYLLDKKTRKHMTAAK